jgi:drug/metabolite transporter (DMT)-like permease
MAAHSNLRGVAAMAASTGLFIANDTLMKLAMADLPPLLVLFMRGVAATIWCVPLVLFLGFGPQLRRALDPWVFLRAFCETGAVLCYVMALPRNPIANLIAMVQVAPLLLIIGVWLIWGERIGPLRWVLIGAGFLGALLVAQPESGSASLFLALGLGTAFFAACRDLAARKVPKDIPVFVATLTTLIVVMIATLAASSIFEVWPEPQPRHYAMMGGAGFVLVFAHVFLFLAYCFGEAATVAPFFYTFTLWAVLSGFVVFGHLPNAVGAAGILLIGLRGLAIILHEQRSRRVAAA